MKELECLLTGHRWKDHHWIQDDLYCKKSGAVLWYCTKCNAKIRFNTATVGCDICIMYDEGTRGTKVFFCSREFDRREIEQFLEFYRKGC